MNKRFNFHIARTLQLEIAAVVLLLSLILLGSYVVFIKAPATLITNSYTVSDQAIPSQFNGFKIGFFSDVCIKDKEDIKLLEEAVEKIKKGKYDVVFFGGDLFNSEVIDKEHVEKCLASIDAQFGKFAVLGEKDLAINTDITEVLETGGFEILRDQAIPLYYEDSMIVLTGLASEVNIDQITGEKYKDYYHLVLCHQPDTYLASQREDGSNGISLQLSGHSHGGYVYLPFLDITQKRAGAKKYVHGEYTIDQSHIIISNGTNSEPGISMRLFCSPDVVSIQLKSK